MSGHAALLAEGDQALAQTREDIAEIVDVVRQGIVDGTVDTLEAAVALMVRLDRMVAPSDQTAALAVAIIMLAERQP